MKPRLIFAPVRTTEAIRETAGLADVIWHECYGELLNAGQIDYMVAAFQSEKAIKEQMDEKDFDYFILYIADTPVGYLGVQADHGQLLLSKIYLKEEYRGMGLAGQLFAFCEGYAAERCCHTMWLTVNRHNDRAVAAYKKAGFAVARTQVVDIGRGYVMDDFVMERAVPVANSK